MNITEVRALRPAMNRMLAPLENWAYQCHAASLQLVQSGVFAPQFARVARGTAVGVFGQHSWIVVGQDVYDPRAIIVDPTLWSYRDDVTGIWIGMATTGWHLPHGGGAATIYDWGRPTPAEPGKAVALTPSKPFSPAAQRFLDRLGPLDHQGWMMLASHAPVAGWPAAEIIAAIADTKALAAVVPIDRLGMLTDRNPSGLYW